MNCNLILNIPHASTYLTGIHCLPAVHLAAAYGAFMQMLHSELLPMTDWYTDELFINGIGIPVVAPVSRIICDTERFRNDDDEPMSKIGMGVCYSRTHDLKHSIAWAHGHKEWVLENIYDVHHKSLELAVEKALDSAPYRALIVDCHSFSNVPLPYEPDQNPNRPDFCIGTDPFHTPSELEEMAVRFFRNKGYTVRVNSPYSGTIVPLRFLNRNSCVKSLMVEINRGLYLKPGTNVRNWHFPILKEQLKEFEEQIVDTAIRCATIKP